MSFPRLADRLADKLNKRIAGVLRRRIRTGLPVATFSIQLAGIGLGPTSSLLCRN
jgi:hypothetical protein